MEVEPKRTQVKQNSEKNSDAQVEESKEIPVEKQTTKTTDEVIEPRF